MVAPTKRYRFVSSWTVYYVGAGIARPNYMNHQVYTQKSLPGNKKIHLPYNIFLKKSEHICMQSTIFSFFKLRVIF